MPNHLSHQDLIAPIRERLERWGGPYIIENVPNAPLREPLTLCGTMFGLGAAGAILKRHRLFESNRLLFAPAPCQHTQAERVIGVYGGHGVDKRRKKNTQFYLLAERKEAMGIDWMLEKELNLAIPPAYSEWLGKQILGGW
jgi:DNA (cytosine-5)-methyltransferase 1